MKRSTGGAPLYSAVTFRFFDAGNTKSTARTIRAKPGNGFSADQMQDLIDGAIEELDKRAPLDEYSVIRVGPAAFNFVWRSRREPPVQREVVEA